MCYSDNGDGMINTKYSNYIIYFHLNSNINVDNLNLLREKIKYIVDNYNNYQIRINICECVYVDYSALQSFLEDYNINYKNNLILINK